MSLGSGCPTLMWSGPQLIVNVSMIWKIEATSEMEIASVVGSHASSTAPRHPLRESAYRPRRETRPPPGSAPPALCQTLGRRGSPVAARVEDRTRLDLLAKIGRGVDQERQATPALVAWHWGRRHAPGDTLRRSRSTAVGRDRRRLPGRRSSWRPPWTVVRPRHRRDYRSAQA